MKYYCTALCFSAAILAAISCGKDERGPGDAAPRMLLNVEYHALPEFVIKREDSACDPDQRGCLLSTNAIAAVTEDGTLIISDFGKPISAISPYDSVPTQIGAIGSGPGEYRAVLAIATDALGRIHAFDAGQRRVITYDLTGSLLGASAVELPPGFIAAWFGDSLLHIVAGDISNSNRGDSVPVVLYSDRGNGRIGAVSELPILLPGFAMGDLRPVPVPFEAIPLWSARNTGQFLYTSGKNFSIRTFSMEGKEGFSIGAEVVPREVTQEEFQRAVTENTRRIGNAAMRAAARSGNHPPDRHASITSVQWLSNGDIWVREAPSESGDSARWIVFDSTGGAIGRVTLPAEARVLASYRERILLNDPSAEKAPLYWAIAVKKQ